MNKTYLIGTIIAPICVICLANLVFIFLIVIEMNLSSKSLNSINTLSKSRVNTFILLACFLFSGFTWIALPITLVTSHTITNVFIYFFSILNALQGVFIFVHFIFTTRILLKRTKEKKETTSTSNTLTADLYKNDITKISLVKSTRASDQMSSSYFSEIKEPEINKRFLIVTNRFRHIDDDDNSEDDYDYASVISDESRSYHKSESD